MRNVVPYVLIGVIYGRWFENIYNFLIGIVLSELQVFSVPRNILRYTQVRADVDAASGAIANRNRGISGLFFASGGIGINDGAGITSKMGISMGGAF